MLTASGGGCSACFREAKDLGAFAEEILVMVDVGLPRGTAVTVRAVGPLRYQIISR